jgi:hypothetical protein
MAAPITAFLRIDPSELITLPSDRGIGLPDEPASPAVIELPEPPAVLMSASGLGVVVALLWRRRSTQVQKQKKRRRRKKRYQLRKLAPIL